MFQPYNEETASTEDRVAWALCQIIDDDAPVHWTRYRFAAGCIAVNAKLMADLHTLSGTAQPALKPLTEEETDRLWDSFQEASHLSFRYLVTKAIEAKLGIKDQ